MKSKIYLSDEGLGHLVRQRAIYDQMLALEPNLEATVQTGRFAEVARDMFASARLVRKFNNIEWARRTDGSPDLEAIRVFFSDYFERSVEFLEAERHDNRGLDFVISDFVYEAFPAACSRGIPSFGVAHFTWDWFFSSMRPSPVGARLLRRLREFAAQATALYFPPFTPRGILELNKLNARSVPFIVREIRARPPAPASGAFRVLIMDSGANVLKSHIEQMLPQLSELPDMHFLLSGRYGLEGPNITNIPVDEFLSDHIPYVDLVITRGGFNTISECVAFRTPLLLIGEPHNPEIVNNIAAVERQKLGAFLPLDQFVDRFRESLLRFIEDEYEIVRRQMRDHEHETNGARVVAADILDHLS